MIQHFRTVVLMMLALSAPLSAAAGQIQYAGAGKVFSVAEITVVYPAGPGENLEDNLRSAQRRAAFLHQAFEVEAEVAPDDLPDDRLAGNLLLLGWNNRLLGRTGHPVPFSKKPDGMLFLGIESGPDTDLLFAQTSPFDPASTLIFWSRIDPERDRFSLIPFIGSDWALYEDYEPVYVGMFQGRRWPLERNPDAEKDHRRARGKPILRTSTEHYDLYTSGLYVPPDVIEAIAEAREKAWRSVTGRLGANPPEGFRIRAFVYQDNDTKEERSGVPDPVHSIARSGNLHMTLRRAKSSNPHEDAHLIVRQVWGPSYVTAFFEGVAIDLEQNEGSHELDVLAAMLDKHDEVPSVGDLLDEEANRKLSKRNVGYPASALLVQWLRERLGEAFVRDLYGRAAITVEGLARALDLSPAELDDAFSAWMAGRAELGRAELAYREALGEARRHRDSGDLAAAADAMKRAHEIRPQNLDTFYRLGLAQMEAGRNAAAEESFRALVARVENDVTSRFLVFGRYQLGRALDAQDRRDEAEIELRKVLEYPDQHGAHAMAKTALESSRARTPAEP